MRGKTHAGAADFSLRVTTVAVRSRERKDRYVYKTTRCEGRQPRQKKTGNTIADMEYHVTADRACFFHHLVRRVSVPRTAAGVKRKGAFLLC